MPIRVEQRDVDRLVGILLYVELDDLTAIAKRTQHGFQATQHDLVVVDEGDSRALRCTGLRLAHSVSRPGKGVVRRSASATSPATRTVPSCSRGNAGRPTAASAPAGSPRSICSRS